MNSNTKNITCYCAHRKLRTVVMRQRFLRLKKKKERIGNNELLIESILNNYCLILMSWVNLDLWSRMETQCLASLSLYDLKLSRSGSSHPRIQPKTSSTNLCLTLFQLISRSTRIKCGKNLKSLLLSQVSPTTICLFSCKVSISVISHCSRASSAHSKRKKPHYKHCLRRPSRSRKYVLAQSSSYNSNMI